MTRWLSRVALVLTLLISAVVSSSVSLTAVQTSAAKPDPQTITVYVTRTGAKYHRDGCRYLSRSKIPMALNDAVKRYTPCSVCKPPRLKQ